MNYQKHRQHHASQAQFAQPAHQAQPLFAEHQFGRMKQSVGMPVQPMFSANNTAALNGGKMKPIQPIGMLAGEQRRSTPGTDKFPHHQQQIASPILSTPIKPPVGISGSPGAGGFRGFPSQQQVFQDQQANIPSQLYSRDNGYSFPGRVAESVDFVDTSKKQSFPQFDNTLKIFLRLASSLELFRYLMKQERFEEVIAQLSTTIKQVLERYTNESDNGFYMSWFNLYSQASLNDDSRNIQMKSMDANTLIEVFEIVNDLVAIIITQNLKEQYLKEYLDFLVQVKGGIDKNLDENEFEGISEFESEIMKHSLDARLYTNLSCYYSKYLSDHKSSHAFGQKATQAEFEIFQLKKATNSNQIYQLNDDSIQDKSNHSELNGLAIGYNNQAVIELKQGNAVEALKLSQSSVMILETPVFQYMQSQPGKSDEQFHQKLQSLLIAYYNLAMSHEQLCSNSDRNVQNENQAKALQIYEQGFELSSRFMNPNDILVKKFKFKLFKIKQLNSDFNNSAKSVKTNNSHLDERRVTSDHIPSMQNLATSAAAPVGEQKPETKAAPREEPTKESNEEASIKALLAQQSEEMKKQIELLQKQNEEMQTRYVTMMKEQKEELESKLDKQARVEEDAKRTSEAEARRREMLLEETEQMRTEEERKRAEEAEKELRRKQKIEEEEQAERERQEEIKRKLDAEKAAKEEQERQVEMQRRIKEEEAKKLEDEERQRTYLKRQQMAIREAQLEKERELEEGLKALELAEQANAELEQERAQERKAQQEREAEEKRRAEEVEAERREKQAEAERMEKFLAEKAEIRRKAEAERMKEIEEEEARLEKARIARQERLRALRRQEEEAEAEAERRLIQEHERRVELQEIADLRREAEAYVTEVEASIQAKQLEDMLQRQSDMQAKMKRDMEEQRRQFLEEMEKQKQEIEEEKERLRQEREAAKRELQEQHEEHFDQLNQVQVNYQDHSRRSEQSYGYIHQDIGQSHQHAEPQVPNISETREPYRGSAPSSLPFDQDIPQVSLLQDTSGNIDLRQQTPKAATLNNISLPIRDYKEVDVNQMIAEEQNLYDASRAFLNNGSEILKEIDRKKKIMISKIVYSKGMYNKFSITARSHQIAAKEGSFMNSGTNQGEASPGYQPVFQLTGLCQEASIQFHPTTLYYYELDSLMKLLMTKEVLPQCTSINHIRCFEDMAKYLLFPFMQLFIPATGNEMANLEESSEVSSHLEVSSQISHNLSNASNPNKTQIELWGRSPGLLKQSIVIDFLRDVCNIAIYHVEERNFRVSITSLEKENKGLNQLVLDLMVDEQSFEYFFRSLDARDFKQNGPDAPTQTDKSSSGEVFLGSVEIIGAEFFKYLEPCIRAYEELLIQEFGKEISFDCVVLDKKGIVYQIRLSEASEESEPKVELWTLIDSQRHGYFMIRCQTLYKLRIKKHVHEEIVRTYKCQYSEFNSLFGIKKHELDRSLLMIFCYKYLSTLFLFMPTMHCNKGDEEDSDYEEEVRISHRKAECLANARKIMRVPSSSGLVSEPRLLTAQLMGFDDTEFLGIKITLFNQKQLKEEGYFFFINEKKWALTETEKEQFSNKKQQKRKAKKEAKLTYNYKLVHFLQDQGFTKIFAGTKFIGNQICWEVQNTGDESSGQLIKGTVFESYFTPEMVSKQRFAEWIAKMRE